MLVGITVMVIMVMVTLATLMHFYHKRTIHEYEILVMVIKTQEANYNQALREIKKEMRDEMAKIRRAMPSIPC